MLKKYQQNICLQTCTNSFERYGFTILKIKIVKGREHSISLRKLYLCNAENIAHLLIS